MSVSTGNDHVQLFLSDYIPKRGAVPLMIDGDEAGSRYYSKGEVGVRFFTEGGVGQGFHLNITVVQFGALSGKYIEQFINNSLTQSINQYFRNNNNVLIGCV